MWWFCVETSSTNICCSFIISHFLICLQLTSRWGSQTHNAMTEGVTVATRSTPHSFPPLSHLNSHEHIFILSFSSHILPSRQKLLNTILILCDFRSYCIFSILLFLRDFWFISTISFPPSHNLILLLPLPIRWNITTVDPGALQPPSLSLLLLLLLHPLFIFPPLEAFPSPLRSRRDSSPCLLRRIRVSAEAKFISTHAEIADTVQIAALWTEALHWAWNVYRWLRI